MTCTTVDELAAAYALGGLAPGEERKVSEHLATCHRPHADARAVIGAAAVLPASLEAVAPSEHLRTRLMATVARTSQDHRAPQSSEALPRRAAWWQLRPFAAGLAAAGLAAVIGLGAWNVALNGQLAERDAALRSVASADATFAASGPAGSGWVIRTGDEALFVANGLAALEPGNLYELWLIDAAGTPIPAGTTADTDGVALVRLERPLSGASTFALTVERERVDAPTSAPVLTAALDG